MARQGLVGCVAPLYYAGMGDLEHALDFMDALQQTSPVPVLFLGGWAHEMPQWGTSPLPGCGSAMAVGAAEAAARVLFGEASPRGKLPVTVSAAHPFGYGLGS